MQVKNIIQHSCLLQNDIYQGDLAAGILGAKELLGADRETMRCINERSDSCRCGQNLPSNHDPGPCRFNLVKLVIWE
jgi:hypothetical protein